MAEKDDTQNFSPEAESVKFSTPELRARYAGNILLQRSIIYINRERFKNNSSSKKVRNKSRLRDYLFSMKCS